MNVEPGQHRTFVEVIVPCHSETRPLDRCVRSVLTGNQGTKVTVVAHNFPASRLKAAVGEDLREEVNWLEHWDQLNSPAGPFMRGLEQSESEWVARLDSDDYLEEGTIEAWLSLAECADAVIARETLDTGRVIRTPPVRPGRHDFRDPVRDRLFYRSAPLGLLRRSFLTEHGLGLDLGVRTGEDLRMSSLLWSEGDVRVQTRGPGYVVGTDAQDRVTEKTYPLAQDFDPIIRAWDGGWASKLPTEKRSALATKFLRIHVFGAALGRAVTGDWLEGDRETLRKTAQAILTSSPGSEEPLSQADRALLEAILTLGVPNSEVETLAKKRRQFGTPSTLIPRRLRYSFHREAPLRFMVASALIR